MDAKITKQRLSRMLSYDWVKIIGVILAICIVWSLIFTMTATQITPTQKFYVYNYVGNRSFSNDFIRLYQKAFNEKFSYEILEIGKEDLTTEVNTILEARFSVGEGDLMFIANAKNKDDKYKVQDEDGNVLKDEDGKDVYAYYNYTETFARGRVRYLYNLQGETNYFLQIENYLTSYFNDGNWKTGTVNEEKAKAEFRKRVKKDKRFKTEAQLLAGEKADIDRLYSYRDALKEFYGYLDQDFVKFETVSFTFSDGETRDFPCYLNINPATPLKDETTGEVVTDTLGNPVYSEEVEAVDARLRKYLAYYEELLGENEKTVKNETSKNMCVGFLNMDTLEKKYRVEKGFQCEGLLFVNMLIREAHGIEQ